MISRLSSKEKLIVQWYKKLVKTIMTQFSFIQILSIKKMTLLGFTLVALPLVLALLYTANQVNQLSIQSSKAIFNVAKLINTNGELSDSLEKMERYASQYLVLNDHELIENYTNEQEKTLNISNKLSFYQDRILLQLSQRFSQAVNKINPSISSTLTDEDYPELLSLKDLQKQFQQVIRINEKINIQSNHLINIQAEKIRYSSEKISNTLLKSLFIIPVSLFIAATFIILITTPLKQLILKIQQLQQGNFYRPNTEQETTINSFIETKEINDALNNMSNRLHALELQKSSFIRHISHELKTPLAAIREGTELIYDHSVGPLNDEQQEITKIIRSSTTRLQILIEDLLDFNIVLDSTSLQDREKVNFSSLLDQVISERTPDIKRKHLKVSVDVEQISIESNTKQLRVIIDNLLSNAIKYSPENGVITIKANLYSQQLSFAIIDQGPGIGAEQQNKIYEPFYQGTPAKNYHIKGSGLGLTIVKELLARLNGNISMQSQTQSPSGTSMNVILNRVTNGEPQ